MVLLDGRPARRPSRSRRLCGRARWRVVVDPGAPCKTIGVKDPKLLARGSVGYSTTSPPGPPASTLLGPEYDVSFKHHTPCAILGARREFFRNTQKAWPEPPRYQRKRLLILGEQFQMAPRPAPDHQRLGCPCPVSCYTGIFHWGPDVRGVAECGLPRTHSFAARIGDAPTGRGGLTPVGQDGASMPRVVPGF